MSEKTDVELAAELRAMFKKGYDDAVAKIKARHEVDAAAATKKYNDAVAGLESWRRERLKMLQETIDTSKSKIDVETQWSLDIAKSGRDDVLARNDAFTKRDLETAKKEYDTAVSDAFYRLRGKSPPV